MTASLLVSLASSVPLALIAWIAALTVDRASASLSVRRAVWSLSFMAPLVIAPMALLVRALGWSLAGAIPVPIASAAPVPTPLATVSQGSATVFAERPDWTAIILAVITIGAAARLSILLWRGSSLARIARQAESLVGDFNGMTVHLYEGEAPVLVGLIRPVVLLPRTLANTLTPSQIALICAHEHAHLRAGDHIANLLEAIAMAVFWFNPVLAPIRAGLSAVREEACDAAALAGAERPIRRVYAEVLLAAIRHAGGAEPAVAFTGFYRARSVRRLRAILTPPAKGAKAAVALAAGAGLVLIGAAGGLSFAFAGSDVPAPPKATSLPLELVQAVSSPVRAEPVSTEKTSASVVRVVLPKEPRPSPPHDFDVADRETVAALNNLLVATRLERLQIIARLKVLQDVEVESWPEVRRNLEYQQLLKERETIVARLEEEKMRFTEDHQALVSLRGKIAQLEDRAARQAQTVRSDMETEMKIMEAKEFAIRDHLKTMNATTAG